jgi:hypothetical protein
VTFDTRLVCLLEGAAERLRIPHATFPSAAGHDAVHLQQICPAAMLFVPSRDGVSHNPMEYADPESLYDATRVLTLALAEGASVADNGGAAEPFAVAHGTAAAVQEQHSAVVPGQTAGGKESS